MGLGTLWECFVKHHSHCINRIRSAPLRQIVCSLGIFCWFLVKMANSCDRRFAASKRRWLDGIPGAAGTLARAHRALQILPTVILSSGRHRAGGNDDLSLSYCEGLLSHI